jgi:hypothetical protein
MKKCGWKFIQERKNQIKDITLIKGKCESGMLIPSAIVDVRLGNGLEYKINFASYDVAVTCIKRLSR